MAHLNTVLHSLTTLVSRHDFECLNAQIEGTDLRQTNRWSQFVALLTSQILGLNSLREIESALNDMRAKLYHVGAKPVARTTLARVNEIELFFKWMKQNLKITKFVGTSENAVLTQIWIALCLYLLLTFIKLKSKTKISIREILNWIYKNLFSRAIIWDYLTPKQTQTIALRQLLLF